MQFPQISPEERNRLLTPPTGIVRAVIDSDTYNEVDDQFAIAYALRSPERLAVEALYAAPFSDVMGHSMVPEATSPEIGMEMSYKEILHILSLMGEADNGRVFRGSSRYLPGPDTPVESDAARDLVRRAMTGDSPLYVLTIGAPTNVASAILMAPEIIQRIVVVWLGGQPQQYPYGIEYNLMQDLHATRVLFDSGVPLVHVPCMSVASHLTTTPAELRAFLSGSPIGQYLTKIVCDQCENRTVHPQAAQFMRQAYLKGVDDYPDALAEAFPTAHMAWSRIIWDVSVMAYMVNPFWCPSTLMPSPLLLDDMAWKRDPSRHLIRQVNYVSRDPVFGDLFAKLGQQA